ncbi:MAG: acetate--CoA ligase [Bacteroidota bacterium]
METYETAYTRSLADASTFWTQQAQALAWDEFPTQAYRQDEDGHATWFEDGKLNASALCLDQHIADGYGEQVALIYDSPVTGNIQRITYRQLREQVALLAGGLRSLGVDTGDTVIIYMPMIPQAVVAMLACARLGITHSVVFGGFAPHELAIRIDDCAPKAIITASHGIEIDKLIPYQPYVDAAIAEAKHKPEHVITYRRPKAVVDHDNEHHIDYNTLLAQSSPVGPVSVPASHPLYILYTSGTTGTPKGIIRDTGGYATALKFSMKHVFGVEPGDVYWSASDVGWVVGHSYIVYGPLLHRCTTVLFEGKPIKTPDAGTFWRVISQHRVKVMFTAPTAIRAIKKEDPDGEELKKHDLSCLQYQFLAGERCDVATLRWAEKHLGVPVIDHWWQTESGWPMLANMVGIGLKPVKPGSATLPVCGYNIQILTEEGNIAADNEEGLVAVKLPLPPGTLMSLWGNPERFRQSYLSRFPGYYFSGDGGYRDEDGYIFITGRVDDIINVAGHRLSTAEMEEVVAGHPAVAECAVFGVKDELKGEIPLGLVVLKSGQDISETALCEQLIGEVRHTIGAVAAFKQVRVVPRLPKTRSGKILRKVLRALANGETPKVPSTIDDPAIIDEINLVLHPSSQG